MKQAPINIKNKRATFDYELLETYTAGIVLTGTEIKSIRLGKASLVDTYCLLEKGELDLAEKEYRRAIFLDPNYDDALNNLCETLYKKG